MNQSKLWLMPGYVFARLADDFEVPDHRILNKRVVEKFILANAPNVALDSFHRLNDMSKVIRQSTDGFAHIGCACAST